MSTLKIDIPCKVQGCDKGSMYRIQRVCQKHYFRFMRNGHYGFKGSKKPMDPRPHKYRYTDPRGYSKVHEPGHFLADTQGMVREHRFVYYEKIDKDPSECKLCSVPINWDDLHIDHIDTNTTNNLPENLRALCRSCNVFRGHTGISMGKHVFDIEGIKLTAAIWARIDGVKVAGRTMILRRQAGMNDYDCVFKRSVTHPNSVAKRVKTKYDEMRGIPRIKAVEIDGLMRISANTDARRILGRDTIY